MAVAESIETRLAEEPTVASLAPARMEGSLVRPAADLHQIERSFRDYMELCERLLVPDDFQQIGQKQFRKKSAWRKLAVAFGVSCEIRSREYEREGRHIIRAEVVERATAPNGRFMDGLGACDAFERCCENPCKKKSWRGHTCCTADCNGFVHFSKPNHDIPATAATRARNRACADLFGMGEVSAEEITDDGEHAQAAPPQNNRPPEPVAMNPEGWTLAEEQAWRKTYTERARTMESEPKKQFKLDADSLAGAKNWWTLAIPKATADSIDKLFKEYGVGVEPESLVVAGHVVRREPATSPASAPQQPETAPNQTHDTTEAGRTCDGCGLPISADGSCGCPF